MGALTKDLPKCIAVKFQGKSLLEHQIGKLRALNVNQIVVVRGYQGSKITLPGIRYVTNPDYEKNNILESLFFAKSEFDSDLIIIYGDIWFEQTLLKNFMTHPGDCVIACDPNWQSTYSDRAHNPPSGAELVNWNHLNEVTRIGKIWGEGQINGEFIGMMKLAKTFTSQFKKLYAEVSKSFSGKPFQKASTFRQAMLSDFIQEMVNRKIVVKSHLIQGRWFEFDTPEDIKKAETIFGITSSNRI